MLIHEFLERSAERFPDKTALVLDADRVSYQELNIRANRLAHALQDSGAMYGERVVVLLDNSVETVISIFGILKSDAIFVVLNPTTKTEKLSHILNDCRASVFMTNQSKWKVVSKAIENVPSLNTIVMVGQENQTFTSSIRLVQWNDFINGCPDTHPTRSKAIDLDLASIIYTSGTTGDPKGVMLTHQNMVAASTSITTYLENTENDVILNVLPLSFDYGLYQILMATQFGGTVVLEKAFLYPYAIINSLKKEKITGFPIVPSISAILLQLKDLKMEPLNHVRYITSTAAPLPVSHIHGLKQIFRDAKIYSMYGLTECKRVSYLPPEELERRPTSVGKGMPNEEVYLVDEQGHVIIEPGTIGELVVRGAHVMKGYWEQPKNTESVLRQGQYPWEKVLYTGDLFRKDEEGFLYFVSRKDDIIKSRGEKVSPKEVENQLYELSDIVEAAVIGVPDEILGQAIKAYIVLKEGSTVSEKEIIAHCHEHLEDFMVPKFIEFRHSLPKSPSGKIVKKGL